MKRVAILVATIAFTVSINTIVFATGVESPTNTSNDTNISESVNKVTGIMPDSMLYFVDKAFDNLRLFLTFDDAKKIDIISQIANERLDEYDNMTQKQKYDLAKAIVKDLEKLSNKLDGNEKQTIEMQEAKKEAVANMVEKRHLLNTARQDYQLAKTNLEQAKKSGDAITAAEEQLKVKEELCKDAKEQFNIAFEDMKELVGQKNDKELENKEKQANKIEKTTEDKVIKEVKVVTTEVNATKKEAVATMVDKRHKLNIARQDYQSAKVNLAQATKSDDAVAIKAAKDQLKVKQDLYNVAKEQFNKAFVDMKEVIGSKNSENKKDQITKVSEDKLATEDKQIKEVKEAKEATKVAEVKVAKEVKTEEIKQKLNNIEIKNEIKRAEIKEKINEIKVNKKN